MWPNPQFPTNLVTFTAEITDRKLYFLSSATRHFFLNFVILQTPANILTFPDLKQWESLTKEDNHDITDL